MSELTEDLYRWFHDYGNGGIWEHFDSTNAQTVARALAPEVERIIAARIRAAEQEPWSQCTGASDCPFKWHVHGCYADNGRCDDPLDHLAQVNKGRDEQRARAEAAERRTADYVDQLVAQRCETGKAQRQLADLEAAVLALRERVLDPRQAVTEGPMISRIKVAGWLERLVSDPTALDRARQEAVEAALAPIEALADQWNGTPDYTPSTYDVGRVDQRHDMTMQLLETLAAARDAAKGAQ